MKNIGVVESNIRLNISALCCRISGFNIFPTKISKKLGRAENMRGSCDLFHQGQIEEQSQTASVMVNRVSSPYCCLWSYCCCCCCCQNLDWHLHELCPEARGGTRGHRAESSLGTESRILTLCSKREKNITINTLLLMK